MKKTMLILMAALLLCLTSGAWAQRAAYYQFEAKNGAEGATYTPLADPTATNDLSAVSSSVCDDYAWLSTGLKTFADMTDAEAAFAIGFSFPYADREFTHFVPTTEGYIALVNEGFKATDVKPVESDMAPYAIGLRASDLVYKSAKTKIAYKAETDKLSVAFYSFHYDTTQAGDVVTVNEALSLNYTVRLYKDGKVEFFFGEMKGESKGGWDANVDFGIGLNEAGSEENNIHYRGPGGSWTAPDWTATTQSSRVNGTMGDGATFIPVGTVWTFTPPAPCAAPTAQVTATIDIIRPQGFQVVHAVEGAADGYVTFVSEGPLAEGEGPENGKAYTYNDVIGTAKYVDGGTNFSNMNVKVYDGDRSKDYYVYTYLYNERCKGDRTYGSRPVPAILLSAPQLAMTYENDKISLKPSGSDTLVVLASTVNGLKDMTGSNIGNVGNFGIPTAATKVGDTLWTAEKQFGGIVIYKGLVPAVAFDYAETLKPFTNYHFAAFRRDAAGGYVSWFAQADTLTPAAIPFFDDFKTSIATASGEPMGYTGNGTFSASGVGAQAQVAANADGDAARMILETPAMLFPTEVDARLIFSYNYIVFYGWGGNGYLKDASDYENGNGVVCSICEEGGEWEEVYRIGKENPDYFMNGKEFKQHFITLSGHRGKRCRVRLEVIGKFSKGAKVTIQSISIIEKPACDAPLTVSVLSEKVYGDSAYMAWQAFDADQNTAAVAYRLADETAWHTLLEQTSDDTLGLGGLPHRANVVLGAKTLCTGGKESAYIESAVFKTGYQIPFVEDFSAPGVYEQNTRSYYGIPEGWATSTSGLGTLRLTSGVMAALYSDVSVFNKTTQEAYDPTNPGGDLCMKFETGNAAAIWLVMPPLGLAANHGAVLSFDAALMKAAVPATADDIHADATLVVYAAAMTEEDGEGTQTFAAENAILTLDKAKLTEIGALKHMEAVLPADLTGKVRVGIYYNVGDDAEATLNQLYLDNIALAAPCGAVADLKTVTVGETTAEIRWRAYPNVAKYSVTVAEAEGTATPETKEVTESKAILTGLEKATAYKVSVTYACADGNAPVAEISFTTGGMPCDVPTDLTATAVTQTSATLSWTGAAETYRLEFKEADAAAYVSRDVTGKTYALTNLHAGTDYVFRVKAVCNAAAGDESDWSEDKPFKTADLTCFAPTALTVTPSFSQAEATWEGESDQYQLAYKQGTATSTPWTIVPVAAKRYTLTGLKAETLYSVRVRSICAAGDTSAYSEIKEFTTIAMVPCPVPADLRVEDTTVNSAKLVWDKDEQHEGFLLRYRETTATAWDSVKDLKVTAYALGSLKANTAYIWSVNAFCSENRVSGWATANTFTTLKDETANEDLLRAAFDLYAAKGRIHLLNRGGLKVSAVEVYTADGRLLRRENVRTTDNVSIPVPAAETLVMVLVKTEVGRVAYKILLP